MESNNYSKEEYQKNKIKDYYRKKKIKSYYAKKNNNKIIVKSYMKKRNEKLIYKITTNLATRVAKEFDKIGIKKTMKHMDLIGCTYEKLETHIYNQFTDGMSIKNYGEWEVDHIIPIASFDLTDIEQQKKMF